MYPPQGTKCTMWETLNLHRYSGLSKTETSSRQGNHINVHIHIIANSKEICVLASFISLKQLIGLVFRLHILSDTWLHYWPFVLCEIQKQRWCISQKKKKKKSSTFGTQKTLSTWGSRPACTFWLYHAVSKNSTILNVMKYHIKNKLYHVESRPRSIIRDTVFT